MPCRFQNILVKCTNMFCGLYLPFLFSRDVQTMFFLHSNVHYYQQRFLESHSRGFSVGGPF